MAAFCQCLWELCTSAQEISTHGALKHCQMQVLILHFEKNVKKNAINCCLFCQNAWSNLIGSANIPAVVPECVQQWPDCFLATHIQSGTGDYESMCGYYSLQHLYIFITYQALIRHLSLLTLVYMIGPIRGNNSPKNMLGIQNFDWWKVENLPSPMDRFFLE